MTDAPKPRQRRKDARPGELLAAALDVFVEKGFAATRLDDIAARAGVAKGTLYLYFASKEALFMAVVKESVVSKIQEGEALLQESTADPATKLAFLVRCWWQEIGNTKSGGLPKLIMAEASNFPEVAQYFVDNVIKRGRDLFRRVVEEGIAQGVFRPCDPLLVCDLAIKPLSHYAMCCHSFAPFDPDQPSPEVFLAAHLDLLLNGLCVRPTPVIAEPRSC